MIVPLRELMGILGRLGGVSAGSPQQATHLVMPQLRRTDNLLLCLPRWARPRCKLIWPVLLFSSVQFVLTTAWMEESGSANRWGNLNQNSIYIFSKLKIVATFSILQHSLFSSRSFHSDLRMMRISCVMTKHSDCQRDLLNSNPWICCPAILNFEYS